MLLMGKLYARDETNAHTRHIKSVPHMFVSYLCIALTPSIEEALVMYDSMSFGT